MRKAFLIFAVSAVLATSIIAASSDPFVRVNDLPEMKPAVNALRDDGVLVDVAASSDPKSSKAKSDYAVVCIGARVPASFAIQVLKRALPLMPWIKYAFIQDDPKYADMIHLSGHVDWVPYKKLQPLTKQDFEKVMRSGQTDKEFRALVRSFAGVETSGGK